MTIENYDYRYERKPGLYVYKQTEAAASLARKNIKSILKRYKPDQIFYHFGKRGGHLAALRAHKDSQYFTRFDITNFFGQITRTRVARALREIGFTHQRAFNIAIEAVVVEEGRKTLPYGFCQSPLLATLVLETSNLGRHLIKLSNSGCLVSVYMDDILISANDKELLFDISQNTIDAANVSGFPLSSEKQAISLPETESFNCSLREGHLSLLDSRMRQFFADYQNTGALGKAAIEKYIEAISSDELVRFHEGLRAGE